jgi:hypothetical protein
MTQVWSIAASTGHPAAPRLRGWVREALSDWFTWTPGEAARYFCRYPAPWNGLVGLTTSYGSGGFTDNHFHYGYLVLAAALYAQRDPAWAADYGAMVRLVAKQYANWERDDRDFPFLRTFDPWAGHSYAGGLANAQDGNNQESTSEAMQSWAGQFLMGVALGDRDMTAAGAMGYAIEAAAVYEYWFDYHGWKDGPAAANHPPAYKAANALVSVLRDRDIGYWTWFSGKAEHVYGIQFIPTWAWMTYLGRDPAFMEWLAGTMVRRQAGRDGATLLDLGDGWGVLGMIGAVSFNDPQRIATLFDQAAERRHPFAQGHAGLVHYWMAHTLLGLGRVAPDCHASLPASAVFRDAAGRLAVVAWNPGNAPAPITVYRDGAALGKADVAPGLALLRDQPFLAAPVR